MPRLPAGRRTFLAATGNKQGRQVLAAGAACCAPTGCCYGKARPGVESGSKLPHSKETRRRLIWSSAAEKSKEPALRKGLWVNPLGIHGTGPALRKPDVCHSAKYGTPLRGLGT